MAVEEDTRVTRERKWCGVAGFVLSLVPIILIPVVPPGSLFLQWVVRALLFVWAVGAGHLVTQRWSNALHEGLKLLRKKIESAGEFCEKDKRLFAEREPWIQCWIGVFERAFYVLLFGLDFSGGAIFLGAWIALKLAGEWQPWDSRYGRAVFAVALLGNAMSAWFGVIAGLVLRYYLDPSAVNVP